MGMFDYLRCEHPLPDGWEPREPLQTKDFDCEMVTHVITKDGRLMLEQVDEVQEVPKHERPYPNDDGLPGLYGSVRYIKSRHDANFHGIVNFYGGGFDNDWHEYNAKFTHGQLVEIVPVRDPPDALAAAHRLLRIEATVLPKPPPGIMADAFCVARALVDAPAGEIERLRALISESQEALRYVADDAMAEAKDALDTIHATLLHRHQPQDATFHRGLKALRDGDYKARAAIRALGETGR